jgi:hypothetical protein
MMCLMVKPRLLRLWWGESGDDDRRTRARA